MAVVAIAPFARGLLRGESFFLRDLSRQFLPLRLFVVEGLLAGEVRYWNPYSHEGEPLSLPPLSYPPDLLHVLAPDEAGVSLLLALHGPLAALLFLALARGLGASLPENVDLYEASPVVGVDPGPPFRLEAGDGTVLADRIFLTLNAFAPALGLLRRRVFPLVTYASLTRPLTEAEQAEMGDEREWGMR